MSFLRNNLDNVYQMNTKEKDLLQFFEKKIPGIKPADANILVASIQKYSPDLIFKLCHHSKSFAAFCENHPDIRKAFANYLKNTNNLYEPITSVDNNISHSILDLYCARYSYGLWEQHKTPVFLNLACGFKSFQALADRIDQNTKSILAGSPDKNTQLQEDIQLLGNLYWAPGLIHGFLAAMNVANYYSKNTDEYASLANVFYKIAYKNILLAEALFESPLSQLIMKQYYNDETKDKLLNSYGDFTKAKQAAKTPLKLSSAELKYEEEEVEKIKQGNYFEHSFKMD